MLAANNRWDQKKPTNLKMQKESEDNIIKITKNLFRIEKENEAIKDWIIRDIKTWTAGRRSLPVRVGNIWNNNYIEHESSRNGRNENLFFLSGFPFTNIHESHYCRRSGREFL